MSRRMLRPAFTTRLIPIQLVPGGPTIFAKEEFTQPGGSIKDRPARAMIAAALRSGELRPGQRLLDAGSGSTAVAEAQLAAELGHPFTAVLPDDASRERLDLIRAYGGEVRLTPASVGIAGAMAETDRLASLGHGYYLNQFQNPANPDSHCSGTAPEIDRQLGGRRVDAIVCGCGTGGTLFGTWRGLVELGHPALPVQARPVCDGGFSRKVPGIADGLGFASPRSLPELTVESVDEADVFAALGRLHKLGFAVGPSSGLNVAAALAVAAKLWPSAVVVTILVDRLDRYLSTGLLAKCR